MKAMFFALALGVAVVPLAGAQQTPPGDDGHGQVIVPFNISLLPALSIAEAVADGRTATTNLSFTIIGGRADELAGVQYGGLWQTFTGDATGLFNTGIFGSVGGDFYGSQSAGIVSRVRGAVSGAQAAGIMTIAGGKVDGIQVAGMINAGATAFRGAQFAGFMNTAKSSFAGFEMAGLVNAGMDSFTGAQLSGLVNMTNGRLTGLQASGFANAAGTVVSGIQTAGLVNIARTVGHDAIQIAPVNLSGTNDGIPVGPISYVKSVGLGGDLWVDASGFVNLGLRTGNDRFYDIVSVGMHPGDPEHWSVGWTFGGTIEVGGSNAFAIDATARHLVSEDDSWTDGAGEMLTLRFLGQWEITDHLTLYAGPTINYCRTDTGGCPELTPWSFSDEYTDGHHHRVWPGFALGMLVR